MLGYDVDDLKDMLDGIETCEKLLESFSGPALSKVKDRLNMTSEFLQGLSAEGYFDQSFTNVTKITFTKKL